LIPRRLIELEGCGLSLTVGAQAFFDPKILAEGRFPFFSFLLFLSLGSSFGVLSHWKLER